MFAQTFYTTRQNSAILMQNHTCPLPLAHTQFPDWQCMHCSQIHCWRMHFCLFVGFGNNNSTVTVYTNWNMLVFIFYHIFWYWEREKESDWKQNEMKTNFRKVLVCYLTHSQSIKCEYNVNIWKISTPTKTHTHKPISNHQPTAVEFNILPTMHISLEILHWTARAKSRMVRKRNKEKAKC